MFHVEHRLLEVSECYSAARPWPEFSTELPFQTLKLLPNERVAEVYEE